MFLRILAYFEVSSDSASPARVPWSTVGAARHVPAHAPHLVDRAEIEALHRRFPKEFARTSANRFRSSSDMQFAFAYFHWLLLSSEHLYDDGGEVEAGDFSPEYEAARADGSSPKSVRSALGRSGRSSGPSRRSAFERRIVAVSEAARNASRARSRAC